MAEKDEKEPTPQADADKTEPKPEEKPEVPPVQTQHSLTIGGKTLQYTATAGLMPLRKDDEDEPDVEAHIFFTAYTLDAVADPAQRPLVFVFNGGPGSASVWLHLGALGPRRVQMQDEGWMPPPPYRLVDNDHTWLDFADLVFIDPVGTGYSRAAKKDLNKNYWNLEGDLKAVGEFIRLYLTRYQRWESPLYLAGESYGTTRAAGLAGHLFERGIAFNALFLISTTLNFQTIRFERGNDLPFVLFLPTYTASAWYHGKLPDDLQQRPLADVVAEVEAWAETDYAAALAKGDRLTDDEQSTHPDLPLLQGTAARRKAHRRAVGQPLQGPRRAGRDRVPGVRSLDDGHLTAVHRHGQQLPAPRPGLRDRPRIPHAELRREQRVGVGARQVPGYE